MELKVWVEGIQRIVCGVTVNTTCQDVVFALAHATGKVGRFTLIERWRNNERHLAPNENPLKLLLKWGEYANDVQFILQRSESKQVQQGNQTNCNASTTTTASPTTAATAPIMQANAKKPLGLSNSSNNNNNPSNKMECIPNALQKQKSNIELSYKSKELKKSFGAYDTKHIENIGIVKGVPQQQPHQQQQQHTTAQQLLNASNQKSPTITNNNNNSNNNNNNNSTHNSPVPQMMMIPKHEKSHSNPIEMTSTQTTNVYNDYYDYNSSNNNNNNNNNHIYSQLGAQHSKSINEINLAEVRNALDRRGSPSNSPNELYYNHNNINNNSSMTTTNNNNANINNNNTSHENLLEIYANTSSSNNNTPYNASPDLYKQTPTISANGALVPPPYRDPPPPRNSPMQRAETISNSSTSTTAPPPVTTLTQNPFLNSDYNCNNEYEYEFKQFGNSGGNVNNGSVGMDETEGVFQVTQYNDLLQLIKFQREKISTQQLELNKFDAEIVFLETKERDQAQELEAISREITKADQIFRQGSEQLQTLQYVEEENELVKQQEKTLKSEITLLRSKLTNCETELLQCKNKIRILMDDVEIEQRAVTQKQKSNRQNVERDFLIEMERIQSEIDQALHNTDTSNKTADNLKKELVMIENAIAEKKRQVEQLVNEMKEVNLQSLTVTTTEEIKHLLEGTNKQGSARRIIGSPRQLENAVPTSKNPHGVWV